MKEIKDCFKAPYHNLCYCMYMPNETDKKMPLIVHLHGAGEKGNTLEEVDRVKVNGLPENIERGNDYPAYVLCPMCPNGTYWSDIVFEVKDLIDNIVEKYNIDTEHIAITGLSMGGYGTYTLAIEFPEFFSAVAPICGGGMTWTADRLVNCNVWAFHGDLDMSVPIRNNEEMINRLNAAGGDAKFTVFKGVAHNSWENAFNETDLINWLITTNKKK